MKPPNRKASSVLAAFPSYAGSLTYWRMRHLRPPRSEQDKLATANEQILRPIAKDDRRSRDLRTPPRRQSLYARARDVMTKALKQQYNHRTIAEELEQLKRRLSGSKPASTNGRSRNPNTMAITFAKLTEQAVFRTPPQRLTDESRGTRRLPTSPNPGKPRSQPKAGIGWTLAVEAGTCCRSRTSCRSIWGGMRRKRK